MKNLKKLSRSELKKLHGMGEGDRVAPNVPISVGGNGDGKDYMCCNKNGCSACVTNASPACVEGAWPVPC